MIAELAAPLLAPLGITPGGAFSFGAVAVELLLADALFLVRGWDRARAPRRFALALLALPTVSILISGLCSGLPGRFGFDIVSFSLVYAASCVAVSFFAELDARASVKVAICGYAVQHVAAAAVELARFGLPLLPAPWGYFWEVGELLRIIVFALVYALFWRFFVPRYDIAHASVGSDAVLAFLVASVLIVTLGVSSYAYVLPLSDMAQFVARSVSILTCVMILLVFGELSRNQRLTDEVLFLRRLGELESQHYEALRATIEDTNIRYHDLKHQLLRLKAHGTDAEGSQEELDEMVRSLEDYADVAKTGIPALDAVLTEKSRACRRREIRLTYLVDARALAGVSDYDIYSLFGNALDNAIEASERLGEVERRVVKLAVSVRGAFACVEVTNYFDGLVGDGRGGLATTKDDAQSHGYGMRSMRAIVEGLDGELGFSAEGGLFTLTAVFPLRG